MLYGPSVKKNKKLQALPLAVETVQMLQVKPQSDGVTRFQGQRAIHACRQFAQFSGIDIGECLIAELFGVYYTGGALNPARAFGPCVVAHEFYSYHWIY